MPRVNLEVLSPAFAELIDPNAELEHIGSGFVFTEGPVWNADEQCLYFSDMPGDKRRRWSTAGGIEVVRDPSNKCNGMTYDAAGNLLVCEHVTSRLVRETPDGRTEIVASHYQDRQLNSPNDVCAAADGTIYFTDPTYGRKPGFGLERAPDLDFRGLYRVAPQGTLHLEHADFGQPNGVCLSPDETVLYVNDTERACILRFRVAADGGLGEPSVFAADVGTGDYMVGVVDGMKCDERGNIWVTGPGGIWVISPAGEHIGSILLAELPANLTWGGPDWRDLFVTAQSSVLRVRLKVRGHREPYMTGWD